MKKALSVFLTAILTFGAVFATGCADNSDDNSSSAPEVQSSVEEQSKPQEAKKIRVASFNIAHVGQYNFTDANYQELANDILSQDLDIVGIQEAVCGVFSAGSPNERFTDSLAKLKELTKYEYVYYLGWDDTSNTAWGILSKYPVSNLGEGTLKEAPIETLTTNNDHKYSETEFNSIPNYAISEAEGGTLLEIDVDGTKINFWVTHGKPATYPERFALLNGSEDKFIMVGDFNNPAYEDLTNFALNSGVTLGSYMSLVNNENNKLITFPRDQKFMDNILYTTDDFSVVSSGVVENNSGVSDHYLLWAELEIK